MGLKWAMGALNYRHHSQSSFAWLKPIALDHGTSLTMKKYHMTLRSRQYRIRLNGVGLDGIYIFI